jgi:large subunit ribosomal protein L29
MTKAIDFRELGVDELRQRELDIEDQLFRMRIQKAMGQLETPNKIQSVRRERARLKTILRERELEDRAKLDGPEEQGEVSV